jgi:hypothetical protein
MSPTTPNAPTVKQLNDFFNSDSCQRIYNSPKIHNTGSEKSIYDVCMPAILKATQHSVAQRKNEEASSK